MLAVNGSEREEINDRNNDMFIMQLSPLAPHSSHSPPLGSLADAVSLACRLARSHSLHVQLHSVCVCMCACFMWREVMIPREHVAVDRPQKTLHIRDVDFR